MGRVLVALLLLLAWPSAARADGSVRDAGAPRVESLSTSSRARKIEFGVGIETLGREVVRKNAFGGAIFVEIAMPSMLGLPFLRSSARLGVQYLESRDPPDSEDRNPNAVETTVSEPLLHDRALFGLVELCPFGARTTFEGSFNVGLSACVAGHIGQQGIRDSPPSFWLDGGGLGRVYAEIGPRNKTRFVVGANLAVFHAFAGPPRPPPLSNNYVMQKFGLEAGILFP